MTCQLRFKKTKFDWLRNFIFLIASIIIQIQITSNASASEISELSDSLICRLGIIDENGEKKWASDNYSKKYRLEASSRGINCLSDNKKSTKHKVTSTTQTPSLKVEKTRSYDFGKAFKGQSSTTRKQVQFALRSLGFYSKNVDGLWGPGTKKAIESYAISNNLLNARPETIFRDITASVKVPTSFASARSTKSNKKSKASGEANLFKLLVLGGLCATTPDPSACLAGAASSLSGSKRPDYSSIDDGIGGGYSGFSSSNSSSRLSSGGRTIWHSDGSSSRISSSGRNIYHSDGSSSRLGAGGRVIYNSDGSSSRLGAGGRNIYHSDGSSSRLGAGGRVIYNSDGSSCRISASGRNMYCN